VQLADLSATRQIRVLRLHWTGAARGILNHINIFDLLTVAQTGALIFSYDSPKSDMESLLSYTR